MDTQTQLTPARRCGAVELDGQRIGWRVWAPRAETVELILFNGDRRHEHVMQPEGQGFFHIERADIPDGQRYLFRLDDRVERPDPCSLWQPDGVHAPSAVLRTGRFEWTDDAWRGISRRELVFYELHVGTFTPDGTFEAAIERLESLRELGVTALEIMPVAQFPGLRNWGYDGVYPYAVQQSYGGPVGLQRLVDACHAAGLAVFLDVVYNHLGPEGNYLHDYGPYFTNRYQNAWGAAFNYDGPGSDAVRDFVLDNAQMWLEEFHFDGLRLDAVHAIIDLSARHILHELQDVANEVEERVGRQIHIVAESDLNDPRFLFSPDRGGFGLEMQWSDDFHHTIHAYMTGERQGYYEDYGEAEQVARAFEEPFLYAGTYSRHRNRRHGAPAVGLGGDRFVVAVQNHDQVGNRARGDRLSSLVSDACERLIASLLLMAPHIPLLFMGQEYGEKNPFLFFCSFEDDDLNVAVREGRRQEFSSFAWQGEVPDPSQKSTFDASRLTWQWPAGTHHAGLRQLYHDLLQARRNWPAMANFDDRKAFYLPDQHGDVLRLIRGAREYEHGGTIEAIFNLTGERQALFGHPPEPQVLLFSSECPHYHGHRQRNDTWKDLLPYECQIFGPPEWETFLGAS